MSYIKLIFKLHSSSFTMQLINTGVEKFAHNWKWIILIVAHKVCVEELEIKINLKLLYAAVCVCPFMVLKTFKEKKLINVENLLRRLKEKLAH